MNSPSLMHPSVKSLDSFFKNNDQVIVIKGAWGVGKTFLWNSYIQERIEKKDLSQIAYSYVSLFGKTSLADIRASIFQLAKPISPNKNIDDHFDRELEDGNSLLSRAPWVRDAAKKAKEKAPLIGWLTHLARSAPYTDKFAGIIGSLEYSLVKNYVVCFDDMERKGGSLSVREIMGLADELARRKNCKVVLIFNDNSFSEDNDKREFESYREKVVDAELDHNPTHEQNLECVFPSTHRLFSALEVPVVALDLKNIRVIKKLKNVIDTFWSELENSSGAIISEFINHAAVICWSYYLRRTALSFDFLKVRLEDSSWSFYSGSKDKEISADEKLYHSIASTLRLSPSIFDKYIISYLERGYVDVLEVKVEIQELSKKIDANRAHKELSDVWYLYSDSFADNQAEIISSFKTILLKDADKLNLSEYAAALEMLVELGEDVENLMNTYVTLHEAQFMAMDRHDTSVARRVSYKPLMERIKSIQATRNDHDIDQVCIKIATTRGWNPEDFDFLHSVTQDEFVAWIKTNPIDLPTKLRSGLLFFGTLQGSNPDDTKKCKLIYENVRAAIRKIASESKLNQKRAKVIYDVDVEE